MSAKAFRPVTGRVRLQTPYMPDNRAWMKSLGIGRPTWARAEGVWLVSRVHFHRLVRAAADRFGSCEVWADHREQERCHAKCQAAQGPECVCSCLGKNHGGGAHLAGWTELADSGVLTRTDVIRAHWRVDGVK